VDAGGREDRYRAVGLPDEELDLGAAEDDALGAGRPISVQPRTMPSAPAAASRPITFR
jgi:hypothetical protein